MRAWPGTSGITREPVFRTCAWHGNASSHADSPRRPWWFTLAGCVGSDVGQDGVEAGAQGCGVAAGLGEQESAL